MAKRKESNAISTNAKVSIPTEKSKEELILEAVQEVTKIFQVRIKTYGNMMKDAAVDVANLLHNPNAEKRAAAYVRFREYRGRRETWREALDLFSGAITDAVMRSPE